MVAIRQLNAVKPYWVRVGPGGVPVRDEFDLASRFIGSPTEADILRLCQANASFAGGFRVAPNGGVRFAAAASGGPGLRGLLMIPGDWPEPAPSDVWEYMEPFERCETACSPGLADSKPYRYVVQAGDTPWNIAEKFGAPYEGWLQLRQANHDDPDGFVRAGKDAGPCLWKRWYAGKRIRIPAAWSDPPLNSRVWQFIERPGAGALGGPGDHDMEHTIRRTDTLGSIARKYGVTREAIMAANPNLVTVRDRDGYRSIAREEFREGRRIKIPAAEPRVPPFGLSANNWDAPMAPFSGLSQAAWWADKIIGYKPAGSGAWNQAAVASWLKARFPNPMEMITWIFLDRYGMNPLSGWPAAYASAAHANEANAVARELARDYWLSGGRVYGSYSGHVHGCGGSCICGGGSFTPAPNWGARPQGPCNAPACAGTISTLAPNWSAPGVQGPRGTVGENGDACTPQGSAVTDLKPYYYIVEQEDLANFWKIPLKFNLPTTRGPGKWTWHELRNANLDWVGGFVEQNGACVLNGLYAGAKLKVPANWPEPRPGVRTEPIGTSTTSCGPGQILMGGQCVNLPVGVTVPVGGQCPAGSTLVGGLCIPDGGYAPPPGQNCLPGTQYESGMCKVPGGAPPTTQCPTGSYWVPAMNACVGANGVPPVSGACPAPLVLDPSDNLCKPSTFVKTGGGAAKKEEGFPTWAWALIGVGAAAAVLMVVSAAKKKRVAEARPAEHEPGRGYEPYFVRRTSVPTASARRSTIIGESPRRLSLPPRRSSIRVRRSSEIVG